MQELLREPRLRCRPLFVVLIGLVPKDFCLVLSNQPTGHGPALVAAGNSLGLRVPASTLALDLLTRSGVLATTSVNYSGEAACTTAAEVAVRFPELARLSPEPWPPGSGLASTVVAWRSDGWQVLRQGAVQLPGLA